MMGLAINYLIVFVILDIYSFSSFKIKQEMMRFRTWEWAFLFVLFCFVIYLLIFISFAAKQILWFISSTPFIFFISLAHKRQSQWRSSKPWRFPSFRVYIFLFLFLLYFHVGFLIAVFSFSFWKRKSEK